MTSSHTLTRRQALILARASASIATAARQAQAQGKYPDQLVKLIVALPAGGSVDMIARTLAEKLKTAMGQTWIVDNRAGRSGQIGMPVVARATPDGYTLTVSPASFLTTNKSILKSRPTTQKLTSRRCRALSISPWCWWCMTNKSTPKWQQWSTPRAQRQAPWERGVIGAWGQGAWGQVYFLSSPT